MKTETLPEMKLRYHVSGAIERGEKQPIVCEKIWSIPDIRDAMERRGSHWWSEGAMRFFRTRVSWQVFQGGTFNIWKDRRTALRRAELYSRVAVEN